MKSHLLGSVAAASPSDEMLLSRGRSSFLSLTCQGPFCWICSPGEKSPFALEVACPEPGQHPSTLFVSWDHLTCTFHLQDWLSPSFPAFFLLFQIRELVPESQAYMDLLAFERKLDQTIMRKRVDIQEALKRPMKVS